MFNIIANAQVDDISIVPEDFRPLYAQAEDGTYKHNDAMGPVIKAIGGMQTVNGKLRTDVDKLTKGAVKLDALKDWGDTPEAIAETVKTKMAELEAAAKGTSKIDVEKVRREIMATAEAKVAEAEAKNGKMKSSLERYLINASATSAIAAEKGDAELLMPFVQQHVRVVTEGDDYRAVVVDAQGNTRLNPATGQEMTINDLVKEFKGSQKYARLFESESASGGGAQPRPGAGAGGGMQQPARTSLQKISQGLAARR